MSLSRRFLGRGTGGHASIPCRNSFLEEVFHAIHDSFHRLFRSKLWRRELISQKISVGKSSILDLCIHCTVSHSILLQTLLHKNISLSRPAKLRPKRKFILEPLKLLSSSDKLSLRGFIRLSLSPIFSSLGTPRYPACIRQPIKLPLHGPQGCFRAWV